MESLPSLHHHHHQLPCSSFHYYSPSPTPSSSSPLFLSPPISLQSSPSIRASPSPSLPLSYDPPMQNPEPKSPQILNPLPKVSTFQQNHEDPESETAQILNSLPKVSTFEQNNQDPESETAQILNSLPKVSTFEQNNQDPESETAQILNSLPKVSTFEQNNQDPESETAQILNSLPKVSTFDQNNEDPESETVQFFNKVPSFATITAASVFLFLGFCQNRFTNKSLTALSSIVSIQALEDDDEINLEEFQGRKSDDIQTILHLKLKEKVPIVHSFKKTKTDDDEAWQVLKAQVSSCSVELELVKVGFEEILEKKEHGCNQAYYDCVLEYLEMIDECKSLLKGIKFAMNRCERENRDVKNHLRFFNKVVDRIRLLEGDMIGALKHFQELEKE
ncbi:hypothetical protein TanjilG_25206 [Lupinus angustifolius]|uniref:Uncharacterized protein n=1 Tax=Lupinus angustifolius TaxID=3871 RepID=A0A1J7H3L5_LUPAN|nr:PREDICTED: uncharacterized protein LOC109360344 [Lupinus angustifolius]OIW01098.1 hypothetical protein TanjilG_25206 [Lupinus angustifolius]